MYGNGTIFPTYACDLKTQPNLTDPTQAPLAFSRGPPTPFTSGKIRLVPICAPGLLPSCSGLEALRQAQSLMSHT